MKAVKVEVGRLEVGAYPHDPADTVQVAVWTEQNDIMAFSDGRDCRPFRRQQHDVRAERFEALSTPSLKPKISVIVYVYRSS